MENIGCFFVLIGALSFPVGVGYGIGYVVGFDDGRIHYASGQSTCELIETPAKTTEWECKSNQP